MSNGRLHDDKLFQGLNDRLSDYEAPYDGADWDAMSRSLDKLPKTNQFRWKFSLNTIGIMLGIVGLTVLGVVIAQGNGKPSTPAENRNVTTTQGGNDNVVIPSVAGGQRPTNQPAANSVVMNTPSVSDQAIPEMNTTKDLTQSKKRLQKDENPFRFGDQIDPVKGAIYNTSEDPALVNNHDELGKKPAIYYDIDENGNVKPIFIKVKDTSNVQELTPDSVQQTPINNSPEPTAPTDGQRIGFDN